MKNQILSLIFVISALTGYSQKLPTYKTTSNLSPARDTISFNDMLLVPVGDSVWVGNIDNWMTWLGESIGQEFYLNKENMVMSVNYFFGTVVKGNNDEFRFKVTDTTKYRYIISHNSPYNAVMIFYIRGTMGLTTGISSRDNSKAVLNAFPNPASTDLNISGLNKNQKTLLITNILGEVLNTTETNGAESLSIDTKNLTPGVYFIKTDALAFKFIKE